MSRTGRNWAWLLLGVWLVVLMALADAKAQDKPKDATHVDVVLTDTEQTDIIATFDTYQLAMAKYIAAMDKVAKAHKLPSVKQGMRFDVVAGTCNPQTNRKMLCDRAVKPVMPPSDPKSNVPPPATPVPAEKQP